jgi:hypothetical protein
MKKLVCEHGVTIQEHSPKSELQPLKMALVTSQFLRANAICEGRLLNACMAHDVITKDSPRSCTVRTQEFSTQSLLYAEMCVVIHVMCPLLLLDFNQN